MEFDERSERNLASLMPFARTAARQWLRSCRRRGLPIVIICGTRTFGEQAALYAQGRTVPGPVVTRARAGASFHNFGVAWDFVAFDAVGDKGGIGQARWDAPAMREAGELALDQGLDWGGVWPTFKDIPHIQMPGLSLADLRREWPRGWNPEPA